MLRKNIYDIAREANVSIMTVSRAINSSQRHLVAKETLSKIDRLIKKYHYSPNKAARNLSSNKSRTIGVLLPHITNIFLSEYYSRILSGISNALLNSEYQFKLVTLKPYEKWDHYAFKDAEGIDGLIVTYWPTFFSNKKSFSNIGIPCCIINDFSTKVRAHFVSGDHYRGGEMAAEFLFKKGHAKVAVMEGLSWSTDSHQRVSGFVDYYKKQGIDIPKKNFLQGQYERDIASQKARTFLSRNKNITAFFCCNDYMAYGVMDALRNLKIDCPKKISVMGFDNEGTSKNTTPSLTTINVPIIEIAELATMHLEKMLTHPSKDFYFNKTILPVSLIERSSVMKVR